MKDEKQKDESAIRFLETTLSLARKGARFEEAVKVLYENIERLKADSKVKINEHNDRMRVLYLENTDLKATHQDYERVQCPSCGGAGGFDCGEHSDVCGNCGGDGNIFIKKVGK